MCKVAALVVAIVLIVLAVAVIIASSVLLATQVRDRKAGGSVKALAKQRAYSAGLFGAGAGAGACPTAPCATQTPVGVGLPGPPLPPQPTAEPVCDALTNVPPYELTGTWYGVGTNIKPVDKAVYLENFDVIVRYMTKPDRVLPWTGFMVHVDTPAAVVDGASVFSNDIGFMAQCIARLAGTNMRIGLELDAGEEATWLISPDNIVVPTVVPGTNIPYKQPDRLAFYLGTPPVNNGPPPGQTPPPGAAPYAPPTNNPNLVFYGNIGDLKLSANPTVQQQPASAVNPVTGEPYQFKAASCWNGFNECPYKPQGSLACDGVPVACLPGSPPACSPDGCPGNFSRIAWYVAAVNDVIRAIGAATKTTPPTITCVMWETEFSGSTPLACGLFQLAWGLQQFGTAEDCFPTNLPPLPGGVPRVDTRFKAYVNGGTGIGPYDIKPADPCSEWGKVPIPAFPGKTFGDMLTWKGSGEYYWIGSTDAGNAGGGSIVGAGLAPTLLALGYVGCPQSGPGKQYFNDKCGCRSTVYNTYSKLNNGGTELVKLLGPLYQPFACAVPQTAPTFSIEYLGSDTNPLNVPLCVNSHNFPPYQSAGPDAPADASCWGCFDSADTQVRCGVFNGFGGWTEACMRQFLDAFAQAYQPSAPALSACPANVKADNSAAGMQELVIYDLGFIPPSWLPEADRGFVQPQVATKTNPTLCNGTQVVFNNSSTNTAIKSCVPVNCYEVGGESFCAKTCPSMLPGPPAPAPPPPLPPGGITSVQCTEDSTCTQYDPASYCESYKPNKPYYCH